MKKFVTVGFVFALLVYTSGCSSTPTTAPALMKGEAETQEMIKLMTDMADAAEKKDAAKAKTLDEQGKALKKKMDDLKLTEDEKKKLEEKYKAQMEKLVERLMKAGLPDR